MNKKADKRDVVILKKLRVFLYGFFIGIINVLFASGGGLVAVPAIRSLGHDQKTAQASALAVIVPLCAISALMYYQKGYFSPRDALQFIPSGFGGGIVGAKLFKTAPNKILRKIFTFLILYSGIRMIL